MTDDWWRWRWRWRPFKFMYQAEDSSPLPLIFSEEENWAQIVNQYSDWSRQTFFLLERLQEGHCLVNWTITERSWGCPCRLSFKWLGGKGLTKDWPSHNNFKEDLFYWLPSVKPKKWCQFHPTRAAGQLKIIRLRNLLIVFHDTSKLPFHPA